MALPPGTDNFLSEDCLSAPLTARMQQHQQLDSSAFEAELMIAGSLLSSKLKPEDKNDLQRAALCMLPYKDALPTL